MTQPALQPASLVTHSASGYSWAQREVDERAALAISQQQGVPELLGRVLAARGVMPQQAADWLKPTLRALLPDPFHLKDMRKAATRLAQAVMQGEQIALFGDYDVDGATSCALLKRFFVAVGITPLVHIPDRMKEGYGPNVPALLALKQKGARVVVTLDCGAVAHEALKAATTAGLEIIVIDHHQGEAALPEALAVVNPNRADEESEHRQLAAVGMAFLLAVAVQNVLREAGWFAARPAPDLLQWLDLVALGTICDVVKLTGANRALVAQGLKVLSARGNVGLRALMDVAKLDEKPGAYHAGFILGPRINAGGRVGQADLGVRLLTTEDEGEAGAIAAVLNRYNEERKAIEANVLDEAMAQADARGETPCVTVAGQGWHAGVIGIVAGRLKEKYHRPAAVIAIENGIGKGSARSIGGIDIGAAMAAAKTQGLLLAGGGHVMAAGFTVEEGKIAELREFLNARFADAATHFAGARTLLLDGGISLRGATAELAMALEAAGPYGAGFSNPRMALWEVKVIRADVVGSGHVRLVCTDAGLASNVKSASLTAVAFRSETTQLGQFLLNAQGKTIHLAGSLRLNEWQGRKSAQFIIEDAGY